MPKYQNVQLVQTYYERTYTKPALFRECGSLTGKQFLPIGRKGCTMSRAVPTCVSPREHMSEARSILPQDCHLRQHWEPFRMMCLD